MAYDLDTHRFLHWNLTHTPDDGDEDFHYIDIAKMLSAVNRRTYRQGCSYDVANITFHDSDSSETFIKVCTAPNTWATQLAWKMGFENWMMQQRAALDVLGLERFGPWYDYKVFLNADHVDDGDKAIFIDNEGNTLSTTGSATTSPGEWIPSTYEIAQPGDVDPSEVKIVLMGPTSSHVSLLQELENVIQTPEEDLKLPSTASDSVWNKLSPQQPDVEVMAEVMASLEDDNDFPPYHLTIIPGAGTAGTGRPSDPWVIREACIPGGGSHMVSTGGFTAPCGLICIETFQATNDDTIGVTLELVPGNYKGVSARPMRGGDL